MTIATVHELRPTAPSIGAYRRPAACDRGPGRRVSGADRRGAHRRVRPAVERGAHPGIQTPGVQIRPDYTVRRITFALACILAVLVGAIMVGGIAADLGGAPVSAESPIVGGEVTPRTHVAAPGDTIWSIAAAYRGEVPHARYVEALIDLNGGTTILVGQPVGLP